jgi:hypothetical protein
MKVSHGLVAGALLLLAAPVWAQTPSLGDLAKKEVERRKAAPPATKTVTNDDLSKVASDPAAAADAKAVQQAKAADAANKPADAKPGDTKDATKDATKDDATKKDDKAGPPQDEPYWKGKMSSARDELRRNQMFAEALQTRINALTADFTNRDDPGQRAQIADDRQKALAELDRVKTEIDKDAKAISDIEDEARKANVPPGWIR